jgi:hypothetical protein
MMSLKLRRPLAPLETTRAAAFDDRVLAAPVKLYATRDIWIPLRLEPVRQFERPLRPAVEAADEELLAGLQVHATRSFLAGDDVRIQATLEVAHQVKSGIQLEFFITIRRARTRRCVVDGIP